MRRTLLTVLAICCTGCGAIEDALDAAVDGGDVLDAAPRADASEPGSDAGSPAPDGGSTTSGTSEYFPAGSWYLDDVSDAPKAAHSDRAIQALRARGGWGNGDLFQIDFSIDVLAADQSTPKRDFTPREDEFYSPDCDQVALPVPSGGNLEGEDGYACSSDGDCHLIVWDAPARKLYEMWRADISGSRFLGGCLAVWDTSRALTASGRGLQCTSADAAGFPIAPLLFTADEVHAGAIEHAIRFILPNDRPRRGFAPPATHGTATTGPEGAPYYGVHLRLRADFPLASLPNEGARVVARALQRYGMYHADGGNIALTAQSDRHTQHKWSGLLGPRDLRALRVEDFEVIDHGPAIELTYDCAR
jgi:hypothetical protein